MNNYKLEIRWGLIFTFVMWIWVLLERIVGLHGKHIEHHMIWTNLFAVIAIAIYVVALRAKRDKVLNGVMTWKQGFFAGLCISLVVAILAPASQWVVHNFISPNFFTNAIAYAVNHGHSEADAMAYFSLQNYMVQSVIGAVVMGIITSAVVAYFVRRAPAQEQ